jgi:hypothetical protein
MKNNYPATAIARMDREFNADADEFLEIVELVLTPKQAGRILAIRAKNTRIRKLLRVPATPASTLAGRYEQLAIRAGEWDEYLAQLETACTPEQIRWMIAARNRLAGRHGQFPGSAYQLRPYSN